MTRKMPSVVNALFDEMLRSCVSPSLRKAGFARAGSTYYVNEGGNLGLIGFQRSARSTSREIVFTVNLGVASARLLRFEGCDPRRRPKIEKCHWQQRLGFVMPEGSDQWWTLETGCDPLVLGGEISAAIEAYGVPAIRRAIRDEDLRDLWLTGASPGLTDIQRLKSLSVLLKALGPNEKLGETIASLTRMSEGKPTAGMARYHIERLLNSKGV